MPESDPAGHMVRLARYTTPTPNIIVGSNAKIRYNFITMPPVYEPGTEKKRIAISRVRPILFYFEPEKGKQSR